MRAFKLHKVWYVTDGKKKGVGFSLAGAIEQMKTDGYLIGGANV